jgi:AraC-like DNA-binding protein
MRARAAGNVAVRDRVYGAVSAFLVRYYSDVTPARVASALEMSVRTLQRRLNAEGTSFREIRDRVCRERASARLLDSAASISQIASEFGYGELAAFSKAFKRWSGESPLLYRGLRKCI